MARQFTSLLYCVVFIHFVTSTSVTEWQDGRSLKSKVEWNNEVGQGKLDISVSFKMADNSSHIPMKTKSRNKKFVLETIGLVSSIATVIDFVINKIPTKAEDEIQNYFREIGRQLNEQKEHSEAVLKAIQKLSLTSGYSESESVIMFNLKKLQQHLRHPMDEHLRKDFFDHATLLPIHLNNLFQGLLGKKIFNADVMTTLRDLNKCHGRKLQEQIELILNYIKAGSVIYLTYQRLANVSTIARSFYQNETIVLSTNVSTRLDEMVLKCRTNESKVKEEMQAIIAKHPLGRDPPVATKEELNKDLANQLLSFLEDKYDTKKWFVFVRNSEDHVHLSSGFHQVKVQKTIAATISINPADDFSSIAQIFLQDFKIPYSTNTLPYAKRWFSYFDYHIDIERYLDYYLMMMRTKIDTETIIINQWYSTSEYPVVSSSAPYTVFNSTVENGYKINLYYQVIIIAVKPSTPLSAVLNSLKQNRQNQCRWIHRNNQSSPLGNIINDLYLTVEGDSMEDGAYIIMGEWKNSSSQRWRFVNNQLRNDNGKCLTAWSADLHLYQYLYQYKCHPDWTGQKWYQHGPQIVNGYEWCLSQRINDPYAFQVDCGTPVYFDHWQNFHNDCFGKLTTPARHNYEGYGLLRLEKWKVYLTEHKYDEKLKVGIHPWNNHPSQYWKFDDGKLINGNGNCVIFDDRSWSIGIVNCDQIRSGRRLTYNHKKQIVNDKGYCLSFPSRLDDYTYKYEYVRCRENDQQRWIFEF